MLLQCFTVFDSATKQHIQPFFSMTIESAERSFAYACNSEDHDFHNHAKDYTLFHLGEFDQYSGMYNLLIAPMSIGSALQYVTTSPRLVVGADAKVENN